MKTSLLITGGLAFGAMTFAQEKPNIIVISVSYTHLTLPTN